MIKTLSGISWARIAGAAGAAALMTLGVVGVTPADAAPMTNQTKAFGFTGGT